MEVTRIFRDVIDPQDAPLACGRSGESFVERHAHTRRKGITAAHGENAFQMLALFVPEHDAEDVVPHDFLDALRDAAEKFFAVEDGGDFAADFIKESKGIGLIRMGKEQALGDGVRIAQQCKRADF